MTGKMRVKVERLTLVEASEEAFLGARKEEKEEKEELVYEVAWRGVAARVEGGEKEERRRRRRRRGNGR